MTKVLSRARWWTIGLCACLAITNVRCIAQGATSASSAKPAEALYLELGQVALDPSRVYHVRDASLDRQAIHITLNDGTLAFTKDVMGRVTGAFFEGDGEILLQPPNEVERKSMSLFTGMAIAEERFATAYFRFNDNTVSELQEGLRPAQDAADFVSRWSETAQNLAQADAMRLLLTFSRWLPPSAPAPGEQSSTEVSKTIDANERMFHARLQGVKLGIFDVYYDASALEQVEVGQAKTGPNGENFYDVWSSFSVPPPGRRRALNEESAEIETSAHHEDMVSIPRYKISTDVVPPKEIHSEARLQVEVKQGGQRTLLFELSRFLQVESVQLDGKPIEFIHNPSMQGSQVARRGNDLVAVILPAVAQTGQKMELRFVYGGEVLAEAGNGLLYVGARGTWYPNRGLLMAEYDLDFHYPVGWTLVATGKPTPGQANSDLHATQGQASRWISERPMPVAGFNLGKYKMATAHANGVSIETYATTSVEKAFPIPAVEVIRPSRSEVPAQGQQGYSIVSPAQPSPASNEAKVANEAAQAVDYYTARFGPFPYSHLSLTQIPGRESQGWPGLIFLSSYAFLNDEERTELREDPVNIVIQQQIPAHETAHQWWGDLVMWSSYRDQWFSEGLANYCSLMMLQEKNPAAFRQVMERYRSDLIKKNKEGEAPEDDGPVTFGTRLLSSKFPEGYEAISYGRSTWLFYMLRTMLQDGARAKAGSDGDDLFVHALHKFRDRYQGKSASTEQLFQVFAENLPPSLRYEGNSSLQWFIDGWVNGTSLPNLELKSVKITAKGTGMVVTGTILQKNGSKDLVTSVPIYGVQSNKNPVLLGRVFVDGEESSFHLSAPLGTHKILLDPKETILTAAVKPSAS